jgi:hypothetical protein
VFALLTFGSTIRVTGCGVIKLFLEDKLSVFNSGKCNRIQTKELYLKQQALRDGIASENVHKQWKILFVSRRLLRSTAAREKRPTKKKLLADCTYHC